MEKTLVMLIIITKTVDNVTTFISNIQSLRKKITTNNVGKNVRHLIDNVKKNYFLYALESKEKRTIVMKNLS